MLFNFVNAANRGRNSVDGLPSLLQSSTTCSARPAAEGGAGPASSSLASWRRHGPGWAGEVAIEGDVVGWAAGTEAAAPLDAGLLNGRARNLGNQRVSIQPFPSSPPIPRSESASTVESVLDIGRC